MLMMTNHHHLCTTSLSLYNVQRTHLRTCPPYLHEKATFMLQSPQNVTKATIGYILCYKVHKMLQRSQ